ncbi:uncharacterized protein VTP21DRAFT_1569 [Calcarisporiella thermophila]|uniref:uncharacterized protein n=1 Tax=Calcarisporiella thermophila TaxID=911321 RepID=UPI003744A806
MRPLLSIPLLAILASPSLAKMVEIEVGKGGQKYFPPESRSLHVGDMIMFKFVAGMHSVTQAAKVGSCDRAEGGFDSGVQMAGSSFNITLEEKHVGEVGFFCTVGMHCQNGMKGSLQVLSGKRKKCKAKTKTEAPHNAEMMAGEGKEMSSEEKSEEMSRAGVEGERTMSEEMMKEMVREGRMTEEMMNEIMRERKESSSPTESSSPSAGEGTSTAIESSTSPSSEGSATTAESGDSTSSAEGSSVEVESSTSGSSTSEAAGSASSQGSADFTVETEPGQSSTGGVASAAEINDPNKSYTTYQNGMSSASMAEASSASTLQILPPALLTLASLVFLV